MNLGDELMWWGIEYEQKIKFILKTKVGKKSRWKKNSEEIE